MCVWLGTVDVPKTLLVLHIGSDVLMGVARDPFDADYLHIHDIVKGR